MPSLLSIEWLKVRRYRTFWIILGLFALTALLSNYVYTSVITSDEKIKMILSSGTDFGAVWYNTAYMVSHSVIFLALLMVLLTGNEFQFRTHRQNVIDGWPRLHFLHAKWAVAGTLSLSATLFTALLGLGVGALMGSDFSTIGVGIENLLWILLLSLNYLGAAVMVVFLIRRSGLALIVLLAYYLMVDNIVHSIFKFKLKILALDYLLPFEAADQMLPIPRFSKMADDFASYEQLPVWTYALATAAWIAVFYLISRTRALRSDW